MPNGSGCGHIMQKYTPRVVDGYSSKKILVVTYEMVVCSEYVLTMKYGTRLSCPSMPGAGVLA